MRRLRVAARADAEVRALLHVSRQNFGNAARARYASLIRAAYKLLRANPDAPGVQRRDDLPGGVRLFHLRHAARAGVHPRRPRHLIAFIADDSALTIVRVLHDSMDIRAQLGATEEDT